MTQHSENKKISYSSSNFLYRYPFLQYKFSAFLPLPASGGGGIVCKKIPLSFKELQESLLAIFLVKMLGLKTIVTFSVIHNFVNYWIYLALFE